MTFLLASTLTGLRTGYRDVYPQILSKLEYVSRGKRVLGYVRHRATVDGGTWEARNGGFYAYLPGRAAIAKPRSLARLMDRTGSN